MTDDDKAKLFPPLNLPPAPLRLRQSDKPGGRPTVFCQCRKRHVALTPEEWVRQHFIFYMLRVLGYPAGLVAAEMPVDVNGLRQRADIVAYSAQMKPLVIVECKAPNVTLSQTTLNQACRYLSSIGARAVILTNGLAHYAVSVGSDGSAHFLPSMPKWADVSGD